MVMGKKTELYDILEVHPNASEQEIKKAYRKKALKHHPDKNKHSAESIKLFQEISHAYEILSNSSRRELYDQYGTADEAEINEMMAKQEHRRNGQGAGFGVSAGDLFAQFFGSRSSGATGMSGTMNAAMDGMSNGFFSSFSPSFSMDSPESSNEMASGPGIKHNLKCTLADLYHGKHAKLALNRTRVCRACHGYGGKKTVVCRVCRGTGMITTTKRVGPMVQTWQTSCKECGGTGKYIRAKDVCPECSGSGFVKERKIFDVDVIPGMRDGQEIILSGEADEVINTELGKERVVPGDVIITIQLTKNNANMRYKYMMHEHDLILDNFEVDLKTSLCGGTIIMEEHPSGSPFKIEVLPGELLRPGIIKCVENKGMPVDANGKFGNLYIRFQVRFPDQLNPSTIERMSEILTTDENVCNSHARPQTSNGAAADTLDPSKITDEQVLSAFTPEELHAKFKEANANNRSRKRNRSDHSSQAHGFFSDHDFDPSDSCPVN